LSKGNAKGTFSPDGKRLAVQAAQGTEIWMIDTATGGLVWLDRRKDEQVYAVAFDRDGKRLATGTSKGRVRIFDVATGTVQHDYSAEGGAVIDTAFAPDGRDLVVVAGAGVVRVEATTGKARWSYASARADELTFTPDGRELRYFGKGENPIDESLWRWLDAASGKPLGRTMDADLGEVATRPDGKVQAVGGSYGQITQWDLTTRKRLPASADPPAPVRELHVSADGSTIRGWADGWYEWEVLTGRQTRRSPPFDIGGSVTAIGSPDGNWLLHSVQGFPVLTDLRTKARRKIAYGDKVFRFLADNRLALGDADRLGLYDPATADAGKELVGMVTKGGAAAASDDGSTGIAIQPAGDRIRATRWDLATGKVSGTWDGHLADTDRPGKIGSWSAHLSWDGRVLAVAFEHSLDSVSDLHVSLFDTHTGRLLSGWTDLYASPRFAFSPDGRAIACIDHWGVDVREVVTGRRRVEVRTEFVTATCFTPDGRTLVLATSPGPVARVDLVGKPAGRWIDDDPHRLWTALAEDDAERAFTAIRRLRTFPTEAIAFLKERVKVPAGPSAEWLADRTRALDAPQFRDREKATADLIEAGEPVGPSLGAALPAASPEARRRIESVLERIAAPSPEMRRAIRACEVLEGIGSPEAREVLAAWAKGPPGTTLTREASESLARRKGR
jgi:WD40 repeat protein